MRAEREALDRLRDLIRKYREALPYMGGRSRTLEERLALLTTNRDESNTALAGLRSRITLTQRTLKRLERDHALSVQRVKTLTAQYHGLMEGKFPRSFAPEEAMEGLAEKKTKFMERLSAEMDRLQREIEKAQVEQVAGLEEKKKLRSRLGKMQKRAEILETKLAIYQKDIRDIILDLNAQTRNEQALADDYLKLVELLRKVPDISAWGEKVFREAVKAKLPADGLLELGGAKTAAPKTLMLTKRAGGERPGPLQ